MSVSTPLSRIIHGYREHEPNKWFVVAHAMMLRKYFSGNYDESARGDNLTWQRVIRSLRQAVVDPDKSAAEWDQMELNIRRLKSNARCEVDDIDTPEKTIMENELYSRFLHDDGLLKVDQH